MRRPASWPPARPTLTTRQRVLAAIGLTLVAMLYIARLGSGSTLLADDDEQCTKWPPVGTQRCYEMIPLDEYHYVPDARDVVRFGTESTLDVPTDDDGSYVVHPPVGKWPIALGIKLFGDEPLGWRFFNAILGVLGVALCFSLARRLLGSFTWAMAAAGLLAVDGLWFTMSRIAMLDISAGVATLAALRASLEVVARAAEHRPRNRVRILAGLLWGIALATKWSTASFAVAAGILLLLAEMRAWRTRHRHVLDEPVEVEVFGRDAIEAWADAIVARGLRPKPAGGPRAMLATIGAMSILPAVVYTATFTPWFVDQQRYLPPACVAESNVVSGWLCYQTQIFNFHRDLEKYEVAEPEETTPPAATGTDTVVDGLDAGSSAQGETIIPIDTGPPVALMTPGHPYFGNAITWPWIGRPVVHAYRSESIGGIDHVIEVMSVPNPITWWWAFFFALPWLIVVSRRDRTARLLLAMFAAGWGPYLLADLVDRPVFLFYATPLVPFIAIAAAALLKRLWEGPFDRSPSVLARGVASGVLAGSLLAFAWLYPINAGVALPSDSFGWHARIWFAVDCNVDTIKVLCWI